MKYRRINEAEYLELKWENEELRMIRDAVKIHRNEFCEICAHAIPVPTEQDAAHEYLCKLENVCENFKPMWDEPEEPNTTWKIHMVNPKDIEQTEKQQIKKEESRQ